MMTSFDFQPRTRVVFGSGTLARLGSLAKELGFHRTLLVADAGVVQAGYVAAASDALASAGIEATPFHDFGQNPDSAMVENGRVFAAPLGLDSIIGLGGGSSLDCAKGINFLLTNGGKMADYRGYGKATTPLLPMIGIPTTAGTGSEAQSYAVISDASTHMKMACGDPSAAVKIAILDPDLTMSAPRRVTAMAGYDAIAHAVETWVTTRRTPMSETFSLRAWDLLSPSFERVLENPGDREARASMLLGSHFAGIAIEQSMLGAAHACSNPLTARYDLAHGLALSILFRTSSDGTPPRLPIDMRRSLIRTIPGKDSSSLPRHSSDSPQPEGWAAGCGITALLPTRCPISHRLPLNNGPARSTPDRSMPPARSRSIGRWY